MKHQPPHHSESIESDAVWQLLEQASTRRAGPGFLADTVRAAQFEPQVRPGWWQVFQSPAKLAGMGLGLAAAAALAVMFLVSHQAGDNGSGLSVAAADSFEDIQLLAEEEALAVALEYPEDFSDAELVYLIGL